MVRQVASRDPFRPRRAGRLVATGLLLAVWIQAGAIAAEQPGAVADWQAVAARLEAEHARRWAALPAEARNRLEEAAAAVDKSVQQRSSRQALAPALQLLETREALLGTDDTESLIARENLATLYLDLGQHARAEPLARQAVAISEKLRGEWHPDHAASLSNLAGVYCSMGDYGRALPLIDKALRITKTTVGVRHGDYAVRLHNLAGVYYSQAQYALAEPLFREAIQLQETLLGPTDPDLAGGLNSLANTRQALGDFAEATKLFERAASITAPTHPMHATSLANLAALHRERRDYPHAERLYRQVLQLRKETLGPNHPDYAKTLNNLAVLYRVQGDHVRASESYQQALEIFEQRLQETFAVLSERQQLALCRAYRQTLDGCLSVESHRGGTSPSVYQHVLEWKGAVFTRQQHARLAHPQLAAWLEELRHVSSQLATLALRKPEVLRDEPQRREIERLVHEKERLEARLSPQIAESRPSPVAATPLQLAAALPEDAALIDLLEYSHSPPHRPGEEPPPAAPHLVAFVLRPGKPVVRQDLGPAQPVAKAVGRWRRTLGRGRDAAEAAIELRRLVWAPLGPHIRGAKLALISPDGPLARFPFAALPGEKPDRYLIEELSLVLAPVPQVLPALLAERPQPAHDPSLLALGDVDYGERHPDALLRFAPLKNTRGEIDQVVEIFRAARAQQRVRQLCGAEATEAAFRREAAQFRYVLLATHGFFLKADSPAEPNHSASPRHAPPSEWQELAALFPGLRSGLALAGANRGPTSGGDDNLLTAEEVSALSLGNAELVVLSACESGLGELASGEGALGLQRAFQLAGARSVVATLWPVGDQSTRHLIRRFYRHLWVDRLGKLDSLRQAQLDVLGGAPEGDEPARGVEIVGQCPGERGPRPSPAVWAGFVLSGDWR